ncbi:MAG: hypothetical protein GWN29_11515, partial [Gammaproteobacteria bacterium]|nr:hypothetical protein [Gammaproteobacteria bacterium]
MPIVVEPGWNQFGNPFAFPVAWASVQRSENVGDLVYFDPSLGASGDYAVESPTVLFPFEGCFVRNASSQPETLWVPPIEASA